MASRLAAAPHLLCPPSRSWRSRSVVSRPTRRQREQIRELEALERVETQRLAELEAEDAAGEARRAEYELTSGRGHARPGATGRGRMPPEERPGPAPSCASSSSPGDVLGGGPGQPAVLFAADGPAGYPRHGRAGVRRSRQGRGTRPGPRRSRSVSHLARPGRARGRLVRQRRTVLHDPSQMSDVRTLECVIVLEPGQPRLRLGQSVRIVIGPASP